ncbi:sigma factor-like helix-turn-helix DNA-binding protein [Streptomyces sp. AK02-04a]|uniref:sigma factor-like helix-turn-helix DNA-binding protein n=1 Tax=Streptomyces sp. AK02-04a TaxID=3028649 RepID=UPI0029B4263B|nr:sigma factor-like helix-turn-helix DNA-binding protein [Streptomyces sp. AK02-04a]MDX3759314.1 sigma factor-like helix-turn-helix DNA-binding protein [Streptomyces sp. AK02-04a]
MAEDEEVRRVLDSIDALGEQGDAAERAKRLTELLDELPGSQSKAREMRQKAVREMRDQGMTLREIGTLLGISFGRVRQIADGVTNPRTQKMPKGEEES